MSSGSIDLVPIYLNNDTRRVARLADALSARFEAAVRIRPPRFDPEISFDPSRRQYNSTMLLDKLLSSAAEGTWRIIGVTSVDLFIPVLTYVFGEAQLEGPAAVVSTHRLGTEVYGLEHDEALETERLIKEAVHELGHTFGLVHCIDSTCVMHASTYVEEIDLKPSTFCSSCARVVVAARTAVEAS